MLSMSLMNGLSGPNPEFGLPDNRSPVAWGQGQWGVRAQNSSDSPIKAAACTISRFGGESEFGVQRRVRRW